MIDLKNTNKIQINMTDEKLIEAMFLIYEMSHYTEIIPQAGYVATFTIIKAYLEQCQPASPPILPTIIASLHTALRLFDIDQSFKSIIEAILFTMKAPLNSQMEILRKSSKAIESHMLVKLGFTNVDDITQYVSVIKDISKKYNLPQSFLNETYFWSTMMCMLIPTNYKLNDVKITHLNISQAATVAVLSRYIHVDVTIIDEKKKEMFQQILSTYNINVDSLSNVFKTKLRNLHKHHTGSEEEVDGKLEMICMESKTKLKLFVKKIPCNDGSSVKKQHLKHSTNRLSEVAKKYIRTMMKC